MALLPPWALDTVVAIGDVHPDESARWVATGFLFGTYRGPGQTGRKGYVVFVVTNRHVFETKEGAFLRFNPELAEPARRYFLNLADREGGPSWVGHPNPEIDIAVCPIDPHQLKADDIRFSFFHDDESAVMRKKQAADAGIGEGDGAFVMGFPMGLVGEERNYVVVRGATLARVKDCLAGASDDFLLDAAVFPGNSGGPVVLRVELTHIDGTAPILSAALIGVVKGYIPYRDVAISAQTGATRVVFEENSGLAAAHPIDFVDEAIDHAFDEIPALAKLLPQEEEELLPRPQAEPDASYDRD